MKPSNIAIGMIYKSRVHGGKLTVMKLDWPWMFSCLNHDSNVISHYSIEELTNSWVFSGEFNKAVVALYVK